MRWLWLFSLVSAWNVSALDTSLITPEVLRYAPLRVIGTNLYDFTETIQSVLSGHPDPRYCIRGLVVQTNAFGIANSMVIRRAVGTALFKVRTGSNVFSNPDDQLVAMAAISMAKSTNGTISPLQYTSLPLHVQTNFVWFQPTEEVLVGNLPSDFLRLGKNVQLFALPLGRCQPRTETIGNEGMLYFDYGLRLADGLERFATVFRVTPRGISQVKRLDSARQVTTEATQRLIRWQHQEATNGAAHAQYSLAKRYLAGDGVPTDVALGEFWLHKAAEQKYPDAVRLLENLTSRSQSK